jgi:hypothetical protein
MHVGPHRWRADVGGQRAVSLRSLVAWLLVFFFQSAGATDALIFIQHDQAGPNLPTADYTYAEWIRWPANQGDERNNRILSIVTGVDLQGDVSDGGFQATREGRLPRNGKSLEARGVFKARRAMLGKTPVTVRQSVRGTISASLLLLGAEGLETPVKPARFDEPLPKEGIVVYEAQAHDRIQAWDDAIELARRIDGRSLIVEYPPAGTDGWSKFWRYGAPWPAGIPSSRDPGVPGLVRARDILPLLQHPETFSWAPSDVGRWGGPNRWLEHGQTVTPMVLGTWFFVAAFVVSWAIAQVMNEDRGPFVSEMLVLVGLTPAALVLGGAFARAGSIEEWVLWLVLAELVLYVVTLVSRPAVRAWWPEAHPLWGPSVVGLAATVSFNPLWSDLSHRFGGIDVDVPGMAVGAAMAYLAGAVAFAPGRWFGRGLVFCGLLWGVTARPWWVDGHSAFLILPTLVLVAAEGLFRLPLLLLLALLPTGIWRAIREGVAWSPWNLSLFVDQAHAINLWQHFMFVFSPAWMATFLLIAIGLLIGTRFLAYRLHKLLRLDPRLRTFVWMIPAVTALGVTEPLVLPAFPVVVFAALIVLAYDGLRANA